MEAKRWKHMWTVFHQALEVEDGDRVALLDRRCANDPELRRRVDDLLAHHQRAPSVLDPLNAPGDIDQDALIGSRIGVYRLDHIIGRGGMGTVYAASQEQPIQRSVALKLISLGMDTREVVARFEAERQAQALMDHPNIASVHDAGATNDGRPYFVMELVNGSPITEFCDHSQLGVRERLELFLPVCQAIQHAHQKGIIHRDLKPSNILVTFCDKQPIAKIIDFGIAKAIGHRLTEHNVETVHGQLIGTPGYMSPEQVSRGHDVDTRTDVYSLGVVLYELMTGALPVDQTLSAGFAAIDGARDVNEPATPSSRVASADADSSTTALLRGTDEKHLRRQLRGELDWIVMRALEAERDRRYSTVAELASDLLRYLQDRPVLAGPPSVSYRLRKLLIRHRVKVAVALSLVFALLIGTVGTTWMAIVARNERRAAVKARDEAREEAATSRAVIQVLDEMLSAPDPLGGFATTGTALDITVIEVLNRASEMLPRLKDQPAVEAVLRHTLGRTYLNLGDAEKAEHHFQRSHEINLALHGPNHPESLASHHELARALKDQGHIEEAEKILQATLELRQRVLGPEHFDTLSTTLNLANVVALRGRLSEAEQMLRTLIPALDQTLGEHHTHTLVALNTLILVLSHQGKHDEAVPVAREALRLSMMVNGEEHPHTLNSLGSLATVLEESGVLEESRQLFSENVRLRSRVLGETHPETLLTMQNLAAVHSRLGQREQAIALYREVLGAYRTLMDPSHPTVLIAAHNLARTLTEMNRAEEAVQIYNEILVLARDKLGPEHYVVATFEGGLGMSLLSLGRFADAEAMLLSSSTTLHRAFGPDHRRSNTARQRLVELYEAWERPEAAEPYRESAE